MNLFLEGKGFSDKYVLFVEMLVIPHVTSAMSHGPYDIGHIT